MIGLKLRSTHLLLNLKNLDTKKKLVDKKEDTSTFNKIKGLLIIAYRKIYRRFFYRTAYFFDTNMIISNSKLDRRLCKLITLNKSYFLTEKVNQETENLLSLKGYRRIIKANFKIVTFDALRKVNPEICPTYFNFIRQMNNPAVVLSPNFSAHRMNALLLKRGHLTKNDLEANNKIMDTLKESIELGEQEIKKLSILDVRSMPEYTGMKFLKKKRIALKKKDPHYFNDLRSFSLALLYCLQNRVNVTFITADNDAVNLFYTLTEALSDQWALRNKVLNLLTDDDKKNILSGKTVEFTVNPFEQVKSREGLLNDFYSDRWKKNSFAFRIKFWSMEEQKYFNIDLTFNELSRDFLLKGSTGAYWCPMARNDEWGGWLHIKYEWPPRSAKDIFKMKVSVLRKKGIQRINTNVPSIVHNAVCRYVGEDAMNNFKFFSSFYFKDLEEEN